MFKENVTQHGPVVCLDFDGVLYPAGAGVEDFDQPPIPGAVQFCQDLADRGCILVLYTCRLNPDVCRGVKKMEASLRRWFNTHDFPAIRLYTDPGKPVAKIYVDDRAVNCVPLYAQNIDSEYKACLWGIFDLLNMQSVQPTPLPETT